MKKMFQSSWVDNMGTGVSFMEGPWDSATHTITLKGKMMDPLSGKDQEMRETFTMVDDNNQKMEYLDNNNIPMKDFKSVCDNQIYAGDIGSQSDLAQTVIVDSTI